ncbi:MAG: hypothetical protein JWN89_547 [Parcubacteria group bacterium]|nr:hypothetical protein [Parcubacteria group bacterium]
MSSSKFFNICLPVAIFGVLLIGGLGFVRSSVHAQNPNPFPWPGYPPCDTLYSDPTTTYTGYCEDFGSNPQDGQLWNNGTDFHYQIIWFSPPASPPPATVAIYANSAQGTCPFGTSWMATGSGLSQGGVDDGGFTFNPAAGGTNVSISASVPAGWNYLGATPNSQLIYPGGSSSFILNCQRVQSPDLIATSVSAPSPVTSGQANTFVAQVSNAGAADAAASYTNFQVASGSNGSGTISTLWDAPTPILNTSQSTSVTSPSTYTVVTNQPYVYSVRSCADSTGVVSESDEANNCSPWTNVSVNGDPSYGGPVCTYQGNNSSSCASTPTISVTANPPTISSGGISRVTWATTGMSSCDANFWSGTATNGFTDVSPGSNTSYSKTCTGTNNISYTASAVVTVNPVASVTLTPASQTIISGNSATLTWSGTNVSSCSGTAPSANWNSSSATNGNKAVSPVSNTTYTISCISSVGGSNPSASATVNVSAPTTAAINVSSNVATSWTVAPGGVSGSGTSGSYTVTPAAGGSTYVISPAAVSGYTGPTVTNSVNSGGASMPLSPGQSGTYTLTYAASGPSFNYSLSSPGSVSIPQGGAQAITITETLISGSSQPVTLSASGMPPGSTATPSSCFPATPTCSSNITMSIAAGTATGNYPITVTGSSAGTPNKTTSFTLTVTPSAAISVSCTSNPSGTTIVGNTVTWNASVSGTGVAPYTYAWSGPSLPSPSPTTASFGVQYTTSGLKTAQATVTDRNGSRGTCPAGTIQVNLNPRFQEI